MLQQNRLMKLIKRKGIKTDALLVVAVFLVVIIYVLGLSIKNIYFLMTYDKQRSTQPIATEQPVQSYSSPMVRARSETFELEPTQNPIQKAHAIFGNRVQINDGEQWYEVGDIVEGQAEILAIEPTRILVEWNGTQTYIPFDYSAITASEAQTSGRSEAVSPLLNDQMNNFTQEQINQMQQSGMAMMQNFFQNLSPQQQSRLQTRMMQMGQTMQNMSEQERTALQTRQMELGQRLMNMPEQQRQQAMVRIQQEMQQWMLSDQEGIPEFSLD
ncbi:hypothetical protein ACFLZ8_04000 [Planctomycetota bacterium]